MPQMFLTVLRQSIDVQRHRGTGVAVRLHFVSGRTSEAKVFELAEGVIVTGTSVINLNNVEEVELI